MVDYSETIQELEQSLKRLSRLTMCPTADDHKAIREEAQHCVKTAAGLHAQKRSNVLKRCQDSRHVYWERA